MFRFWRLAAIPALLLAAAPAPAGAGANACGFAAVRDPGLRATFAQFERVQSASARKLCATYLNIMSAGPADG